MFKQFTLVGSEISFINHAINHEWERRKIDFTFESAAAYVFVVSNTLF